MTDASPIRALFTCTGIGFLNRGIETFFREAFDGLRDLPGFETRLLKGAGNSVSDERAVPCLARNGKIAPILGGIAGRSAYAAEQWSSLPAVALEILRFRPQVVFSSEANLFFLLRRLRPALGVPFRLLYSNGGPCSPPFERYDFVHQVATLYQEEALAAGEPPEKHCFVPYGFRLPPPPEPLIPEELAALRSRLGLPADRRVLLSVGWIAAQHKRMDYLIEELALLPQPRPFLQMLGAMDFASDPILALACKRLGPDGFAANSVAPDAVGDYYRAADVFTLASLAEGFGRVYVEALAHGLPVLAHRYPVSEEVLDRSGVFGDFSAPGELASLLAETFELIKRQGPAEKAALATERYHSVRQRFSWEVLRPAYAELLHYAATAPVPRMEA